MKIQYALIEIDSITINQELKPDLSFGKIDINYGYRYDPEFLFDSKQRAINEIKGKTGNRKYIIVKVYSNE